MKIISKSLEETERFARDFLAALRPKEDGATLVTLSGDLGAGKTAFVKCAAKYFGLPTEITSPTFVILKRFEIENSDGKAGFNNLVHIDAYRLGRGEELDKLRFQELLGDPKNIIFLEWPEKVEDIIPSHAVSLQFTFIDETTRQIES